MPTIRFIIRKDGTVEREAEGFVGQACHEAAAKFTSLKGKVLSEHDTPEAFLTNEGHNDLKVEG